MDCKVVAGRMYLDLHEVLPEVTPMPLPLCATVPLYKGTMKLTTFLLFVVNDGAFSSQIATIKISQQ